MKLPTSSDLWVIPSNVNLANESATTGTTMP